MNSTEEAETCPTPPGLKTGLFQAGLDWAAVKAYPLQNWHVIGWLVCLLLLVITWIVAIITVTKHLRNYYHPELQRHKLRVLLFPPVYATLAWFAYLRYDYSTTIMFFATLFEAFAVYNLYTCLQAYLEPFRREAGDVKEAKDTKIMFMFKCHLPSKWGMHYRIITDMLVFQYPIWTILDSFISIFASLKGRYCEGAYSFQGAYVYLTIINFCSLSVILTALFTYLDVFHNEWTKGRVRAHGMFWCVKGPIMVIFYFGDILLSLLTTKGVIEGTDGTDYPGAVPWPAAAVKNGIYVIIICVTMTVDSFLMLKFFNAKETIDKAILEGTQKKKGYFAAFFDAYIAYIPEFIYMMFCCGYDSYKLAKKRKELSKRKKTADNGVNQTDHLLNNGGGGMSEQEANNYSEYSMNQLKPNITTTAIPTTASATNYPPPQQQHQNFDSNTYNYPPPLQQHTEQNFDSNNNYQTNSPPTFPVPQNTYPSNNHF
ncbi:hypothetical protein K501DRAFT_242567 [Backusella circina FSU 941]|nr:hypothetical protein K501DRAFT_242567 [Backusella circina FSU 941]